jgi:hypothetical protein
VIAAFPISSEIRIHATSTIAAKLRPTVSLRTPELKFLRIDDLSANARSHSAFHDRVSRSLGALLVV